jgi:hypothetical protein
MAKEPGVDDLVQLTDRELQTLLREVEQQDVVVILSAAGKALRTKFAANMSERVAGFLKEEAAALGEVDPAVLAASQAAVLASVSRLAADGQIDWPPGARGKGRHRKGTPNPERVALEQEIGALIGRTLDQFKLDEVTRLFCLLSELSRREGILALQTVAQAAVDPVIAETLRLVVDGTSPALIREIGQSWVRSRVHEYECKNQKVVEGFVALQSGDSPRLVQAKLNVIY